jgi:hypothetical protein
MKPRGDARTPQGRVFRLSLGELSVLLERRHEDTICVLEIVELSSELILPFHAMEQVVAVSEDDDEDRREAVPRIIVLPSICDHVEVGPKHGVIDSISIASPC